jgi:hypothetical protein
MAEDELVEEQATDATPSDKGQAADAPAAWLVLMADGAETATRFALPAKGTVGRFDPEVGPVDVDLGDVPEAAYVSRRHAEVERTESGWVLRDLGSSNGLFVYEDGWQRVEEAALSDGAMVALGNAKFTFREG